MGRPREHDERTAAALLDSAERLIETGGPEALSLRQIAHRARTTTRAVYGLFGSKEGLIVALGNRAFEILGAGIRALPITKDPVADLVDAGVLVFRRFALEHPSLFRIGIQRDALSKSLAERFRPTRLEALALLQQRVDRLSDKRRRGGHMSSETTIAFHALCEGLAALELRGLLPAGHEERLWRHAFIALLTGFTDA